MKWRHGDPFVADECHEADRRESRSSDRLTMPNLESLTLGVLFLSATLLPPALRVRRRPHRDPDDRILGCGSVDTNCQPVISAIAPAPPLSIAFGRVTNRRFDARWFLMYAHAALQASVAWLVLKAIAWTAHSPTAR